MRGLFGLALGLLLLAGCVPEPAALRPAAVAVPQPGALTAYQRCLGDLLSDQCGPCLRDR